MIRDEEEISVGGGEGYEISVMECVRQQLPDSYKGRIWYVGDGVRPNLRFDSDLFHLSVITLRNGRRSSLRNEPSWTYVESHLPRLLENSFYTPQPTVRAFTLKEE